MRGHQTRPLYNRDLTTLRRRRKRERQNSNKFKDDVTRDDSPRRFLAPQHSDATLLRHCLEYVQHCPNIAALCCAKNRPCESSRVTSPLMSKTTTLHVHHPFCMFLCSPCKTAT